MITAEQVPTFTIPGELPSLIKAYRSSGGDTVAIYFDPMERFGWRIEMDPDDALRLVGQIVNALEKMV